MMTKLLIVLFASFALCAWAIIAASGIDGIAETHFTSKFGKRTFAICAIIFCTSTLCGAFALLCHYLGTTGF